MTNKDGLIGQIYDFLDKVDRNYMKEPKMFNFVVLPKLYGRY